MPAYLAASCRKTRVLVQTSYQLGDIGIALHARIVTGSRFKTGQDILHGWLSVVLVTQNCNTFHVIRV
jgi:hypothetical protein